MSIDDDKILLHETTKPDYVVNKEDLKKNNKVNTYEL